MPFSSVRAAMLILAAVVAGCSRTPPEPAPAASTSIAVASAARPSEGAAGSGTPEVRAGGAIGIAPAPAPAPAPGPSLAPGRCITPLASAAPPVPAPAGSACPPDPEPPHELPTAMVAFPDAAGAPRVNVELAKTPHDVERGLMFRRAMNDEHGMLFRLEDRRDHTFWMQNTCIPLDMLFVDDDGVVVGVYESAPPLTTATRSVGCPSTWVLEVNAGWCRRHGVKPGQRMGIPASARAP